MHTINKNSIIRIRIFSILILSMITLNIVGQTSFKTVNEAKGLNVGDNVKQFTAKNMNNKLFSLKDALSKGPVVVIFYRGQWCPFCTKHLSHLQDSLQLIYDKGASVIAISPEKAEYSKKTAKKTNASFTLLYDEGYKISNLFDVSFLPKGGTRAKYNTFLGANLKKAHSDDSQRLPIPATYIIGQDGKIAWRQFDPNYKKRSSVSDIIKNIP